MTRAHLVALAAAALGTLLGALLHRPPGGHCACS